MVSHRMMLVKAARDGDYFRAFDIEAAFLNAELDDPVLVSLPSDFLPPNERPVNRLLKALYGLPQAPKVWFQKYSRGLLSLG